MADPDQLLAAAEDRSRTLERVTRETDEAQWARVCTAEGWPGALVCYHIARAFDRQAAFVEAAVGGTGPHLYSWDETHTLNAQIAGEHPLPARDEVLTTARAALERVRSVLTHFSDADLAGVALVNGSFLAASSGSCGRSCRSTRTGTSRASHQRSRGLS